MDTSPIILVRPDGTKVRANILPGVREGDPARVFMPSGDNPGTIRVGNTLVVDAVNGDDGTALRGRGDKPFRTLLAAQTASQSGDLVTVRPGSYVGYDLGKNGVDWAFDPGCTITADPLAGDQGVFEASTSAKTFRIVGFPDVIDTTARGVALNVGHANSRVYAELGDVTIGSGDLDQALTLSAGEGRVVVRKIANAIYDAVVVTGGTWDITVQNVECLGNVLEISGDTSGRMRVDGVATSTGNDGIGFGGASAIAIVGFTSGTWRVSGKFVSENDDGLYVGDTNSGTLRLESLALSANATRPAVNFGTAPSGTTVFQNTVLTCGGTNSIVGTASVTVLSAFANKAVAGTVTQQVGTVVVDSDVG